MADISKPDEPATKIEDAVAIHDTPGNPDEKPASGVRTDMGMPNTPKKNGSTAEAEEKRRQWWKTVREWAAILISIAAFCVSFGSCYGSNRSADTAERALKTTIENFQLDQRAWVGIRGIQHPTEVKEGAKWVFKVNCTNSGKTSAQNVKTFMATQATLKDDPFTPPYGEQGLASTTQSIGTIAAGATIYPMTKEMRPTKEQSEAFSQGIITAYVYGEISYDDVFNHPHCTRYCFYFVSDFSNANVCGTYKPETDTKCDNIN